MTTIDPTHRGIGAPLGDLWSHGRVSPEAIVLVAQRRMDDLDGQVETFVNALDRHTAQANYLRTKSQLLHEIHSIATKDRIVLDDPISWPGADEPIALREALLREDALASEIRGELDLTRTALEDRVVVHGKETEKYKLRHLDAKKVEATLNQVRAEITKINSNNEMQMVRLQTLMQQRQQLVLMATNLTKSLHEGNEAVIRNLSA